MSSCVGYQRKSKLLGNLFIKPSEFLKEIHPIFSCEDVHHLWMCMEPSGVNVLLYHKPSCHFIYTLLGNQMWRWRPQFLRKIKKQRRLCFLKISITFFYVFSPLLKTLFPPQFETNSCIY